VSGSRAAPLIIATPRQEEADDGQWAGVVNDLAPYYERDYERATGQVIFQGPPVGVAGEASIEPAPGLELDFDRVDGRLCRAIARTSPGQPVAFDQPVEAMLTRLFGPNALDIVLGAVASPEDAHEVCPEPGLTGTLSSLARLEVTQVTSPVSAKSPWWAAEAAELAERAGLASQASALASRALPGLLRQFDSCDLSTLPEQAVRASRVVAEKCAATHPEEAGRLLAAIGDTRDAPLARCTTSRLVATLDVAGEVALMREERFRSNGPQWLLDSVRVPAGLFRFGLSPWTDLFVRRKAGQTGIVVVMAKLAPDADRDALSRCAARLVDPPARRIVAQESFAVVGSRAIAELKLKAPLEEWPEIWVEVADDKLQPVHSANGHWASRARRWADAALRAERTPRGVDSRATPEDWAALALAAWDRCCRDWTRAGDPGRAALAADRQAAVEAWIRDPRPALETVTLACKEAAHDPSCLAEIIGH